MRGRYAIVFILAIAGNAWAADANGGMALAERVFPALGPILQQATTQSPSMLSRQIDLEIAECDRIQSRSAILPSVGGNFRFLGARDARADLPGRISVQKTYYDFAVNQPIFYWGERRNTARIGEIRKQIAERNYQEAYRSLAQEIRSKYLQLIVQKQVVTRARDGLAYATQQARIGEERLAKKEISNAQLYGLQLAVEQGQINLERVEFDFEQARRSFARITGMKALEVQDVPDDLPKLSYDAVGFDRLLADFLSERELPSSEAVTARLNRRIAELVLANEKVRLRPKFGLTAGTNQDEQNYSIASGQKFRVNSLYAGVTLNWMIFDGFASQAARRAALARLRQHDIDLTETRERLGTQAQQQVKQLNFSARLMAISDRGLSSSEAALVERQRDYERGTISESDVTLSRLALIDARIAAFNSRAEYLFRVADFLGTLSADPVLRSLK